MADKPWFKSYDPGVPTHLIYPDELVFSSLDKWAVEYPGRTCILCNDETYSYQEVSSLSRRLSRKLVELGVTRGDRIGIMMPNLPEFVVAFYAILKAGGIVVAINPNYRDLEICRQVNDAGVSVLFSTIDSYEGLKRIQPQTSIRKLILSSRRLTSDQPSDDSPLEAGDLLIEEALHRDLPSNLDVEVVPDDTAIFQFSGGTTGVPKAAEASHRNLAANILQFKSWLVNLKEGEETLLLAIPAYHVYGMVLGIGLGVSMGARIVVIPNPRDIANLLDHIEKYQPTIFPAVPNMLAAILRHPDISTKAEQMRSLKVCISGSATLPLAVKTKFENWVGVRISEGYGLSEAPTATHCNPVLKKGKPGSIGLPLPDVDCRIVDLENGNKLLPVGEIGELLLKGPQVMLGYHQMPEETQLALRDGWLFTGDVARVDEDGYFYLVDRKKELIKVGGLQVWPKEVEEILLTIPDIQDVGVAGIPDDSGGEYVKAWIVLNQGASLSEEQIKQWCYQRIARFKVPAEIEFIAELPRSSVGKILRRQLVQRELAKTK